ncbi:MAG TPA: hypothetical protein VL362_01205 [Patescibacteria group bacterium]|nr:hypothetical protein [Patescibacteria group bacterium]
MKQNDSLFLAIGGVAIIASAAVIGLAQFSHAHSGLQHSGQQTAALSPTTMTAHPSGNAARASQSFKDGTYSASVQYQVPSGTNAITANVAVKHGAIASVKTSSNYTDSESQWYINDFESSINADAAGQPLASYSPSRIGGASLTTWAFDNVLDQIRTNAKA